MIEGYPKATYSMLGKRGTRYPIGTAAAAKKAEAEAAAAAAAAPAAAKAAASADAAARPNQSSVGSHQIPDIMSDPAYIAKRDELYAAKAAADARADAFRVRLREQEAFHPPLPAIGLKAARLPRKSSVASNSVPRPLIAAQRKRNTVRPAPPAAPPAARKPAAPPAARKPAIKRKTEAAPKATDAISLRVYGYKIGKSQENRQEALRKAIAAHGKDAVISRLMYIADQNITNKPIAESDITHINRPLGTDREIVEAPQDQPGPVPAPAPAQVTSKEYVVSKILNAVGTGEDRLYLLKWKDYPGLASWVSIENINDRDMVTEYNKAHQDSDRAHKSRKTSAAEPVYREDLEIYMIAASIKQAFKTTAVTKLGKELEKWHTNTKLIGEYVFLMEAVLNYYIWEPNRFENSLKWANEPGRGSNKVLGIRTEITEFTNDKINIFDDIIYEPNKKSKDIFRSIVAAFRLQYPDAPASIERKTYITKYRFDAKTSPIMHANAAETSKATISAAYQWIFDEDFLAEAGIQTMPYSVDRNECTCYLCGKSIDTGGKPFTILGNMDHILPKKISFILNVMDSSFNYSPVHDECNRHKSENLPTFNDIPMNSRYLEVLKRLIQESPNYTALKNRDPKVYGEMFNAWLGNKLFTETAARHGFDVNISEADLQKRALQPRAQSSAFEPGRKARGAPASKAAAVRASRAIRMTRANKMDVQDGGAPPISSLAPGFLDRRAGVIPARASSAAAHVPRRAVSGLVANVVPVVGQAKAPAVLPKRKVISNAAPRAPAAIYAAALPREPVLAASRKVPSPARVADELGKVLAAILKKPIVSLSYILYVTLLATVVDFYDYVAQGKTVRSDTRGARGTSQSGGASDISAEERFYFNSFKDYKTGAELMNIQQRCDFLRFRYRMMYHFSVATYYESGAHAEYILRGEATDANPAYSRYIMQRLDNCLTYFMEFTKNPALLY